MLMAVPKIKSTQDAAELAAEIERMESSLKTLKAELKRFVDQNGAIETKEKVWNYNVAVSWEFHESGLRDMADQLVIEGMNPWKLMTISAANLKKIGWSEEVLCQFGQKKETKKFSSRKR
ncbi:hypothetical protein M3221_18410 [Domibacillus indicus]|uniref:hypothetical protein n=1 Tax=Domibacillus indicus TaxID=1437523 RepID=UPI00203DA6C2|nr:hypothetical protein [Domibacillus indicus]MCM3790352.1 hypothetical protein [Domibacillus indicus]